MALSSARPRLALPDWAVREGGLLVIWLLLLLFVVYPLAMLLTRAVFDNGTLTLGAFSGALKSPSNLRALRNSLELAALVGIAGTAIGFLFAFTVERVEARGAVALAARPRDVPAADFAAVHDLDRDRVLVRPARADHLRSARPAKRQSLRTGQHLRGGDSDLFPDRLSRAAADAGLDQQLARGGVLQPRRLALAGVSHGDAAAGDAGACQRFPAAVRLLAGRLCHALDPRRQRFSGAADRSLSADHRDV